MRRVLIGVAVGAVMACSTAPKQVQEDTLSRRERDSIIAGSRLPGASGVGAATRLADSAAARRAREAATVSEP